ncbi:MAG: hypothetical protein WC699_07895 [Bacteroidales bacterium]|jgi:hypothetical protein
MADQVRTKNPYVRYGILVLVLGVFLWNYFQGQKPLIKTGTLEYRMVTGTKDGKLQVILLETSDRYVILDSTYREILVSEDGELISRPKQLRLLEKYQNIEYRAGFNEQSSGLKPGYRVTRELFNELKFGEPIKYEVNKKQRDSLTGLAK